jgi:hypothetical protein
MNAEASQLLLFSFCFFAYLPMGHICPGTSTNQSGSGPD